MSERKRIAAGLASEVAFAVLPLLVVLMVRIELGQPAHFWAAPEWTFGASILFGQSLVKFVCGLSRKGRMAIGPVALAVSLIVVFGLVPSLIVLTMTLREHLKDPGATFGSWHVILQVGLFALSAAVYMIMGVVAETLALGGTSRVEGSATLHRALGMNLRAAESDTGEYGQQR